MNEEKKSDEGKKNKCTRAYNKLNIISWWAQAIPGSRTRISISIVVSCFGSLRSVWWCGGIYLHDRTRYALVDRTHNSNTHTHTNRERKGLKPNRKTNALNAMQRRWWEQNLKVMKNSVRKWHSKQHKHSREKEKKTGFQGFYFWPFILMSISMTFHTDQRLTTIQHRSRTKHRRKRKRSGNMFFSFLCWLSLVFFSFSHFFASSCCVKCSIRTADIAVIARC